jgi:hypothetical protein
MLNSSPSTLPSPDDAGLEGIEAAIVRTVAYVDVFDYPLTAAEVQRYLLGVPASAETVNTILGNGHLVPHRLAQHQGYFTLPGREGIVATRQRRAAIAHEMWPHALRYGRTIASLPFVRMVAVTGSLAVNNVEPEADIDYLVVTANGRLWLCRALVILVVRLAARRGVALCPNYFLAERALNFQTRDLYTARELAQMVPIAGLELYQRMRQLNTWTAGFLPNAGGSPQRVMAVQPPSVAARFGRWLVQGVLQTPAGASLERWEMNRKIRKFTRQSHDTSRNGTIESAFCPDWCKGHFENHGRRILETFDNQLRRIEGEAN